MKNYLKKLEKLTSLQELMVKYDTEPEEVLRSLLSIVDEDDKAEEVKALIIGVRGEATGAIAVNKGREYLVSYITYILDDIVLGGITKDENDLYSRMNDLDKKLEDTKPLLNIDELLLRKKHYNRDKLAKEFMARKTLAYIKEVSGGEHDSCYLPKLLLAMEHIKNVDYASLTAALDAYKKRTTYLTTSKKYVKTPEYLLEDLPLVEPKFEDSSLEAYTSSIYNDQSFDKCDTKEDVIGVLNQVIEHFKDIGKTMSDINTKTTNEISEYVALKFLEENIEDMKKLVKGYADKEIHTHQFEIEYKNMCNLVKNSAVSRINVLNQAVDVLEESFFRYDYIVDIYSVLNNMINNGKLGDPTKD